MLSQFHNEEKLSILAGSKSATKCLIVRKAHSWEGSSAAGCKMAVHPIPLANKGNSVTSSYELVIF
jgi:hypothetical protein